MIVRMGRPDDVPALQTIEKEARTVYSTLAGFEFVAASPPIGADRFILGTTFVAKVSESLGVSPLSSRWTERCIWPISPFFQTPQIVVLVLGSSNG